MINDPIPHRTPLRAPPVKYVVGSAVAETFVVQGVVYCVVKWVVHSEEECECVVGSTGCVSVTGLDDVAFQVLWVHSDDDEIGSVVGSVLYEWVMDVDSLHVEDADGAEDVEDVEDVEGSVVNGEDSETDVLAQVVCIGPELGDTSEDDNFVRDDVDDCDELAHDELVRDIVTMMVKGRVDVIVRLKEEDREVCIALELLQNVRTSVEEDEQGEDVV